MCSLPIEIVSARESETRVCQAQGLRARVDFQLRDRDRQGEHCSQGLTAQATRLAAIDATACASSTLPGTKSMWQITNKTPRE